MENKITHGIIWKQLLFFFFPIVLGSLFQQIYGLADTMIVGRFIGKTALAPLVVHPVELLICWWDSLWDCPLGRRSLLRNIMGLMIIKKQQQLFNVR